MSEEKELLEKIAKIVGLSKEEINLGLMQDFEKEADIASSSAKQSFSQVEKTFKEANTALQMLKSSFKLQGNVESIGRRLLESYKELGVKPPANVFKAIAKADKDSNEIDKDISTISRMK